MYQQLTLIGNLGNDPEMRYAPSGDAVTSFSLAVSRKWKDNGGEAKEKTVWFRISVWGNQAEPCSQYLAKGRQVMVVGEIEEPRVFTDKSGTARASLEVRAQQVKFLGQKGDNADSQSAQAAPANVAQGKPAPKQIEDPESIPF